MTPKGRCDNYDEICISSEAAADRAVRKVFAILGVDIDKPESVEEFREDLRFGRNLRRIAGHSQLVIVAVIMTGVVYAFWAGILTQMKGDK